MIADEVLQLTYTEHGWTVQYHGTLSTPVGSWQAWQEVEADEGSPFVWVRQDINHSLATLGEAVQFARAWAAGSGYKVGATKIHEGRINHLTIRLRRP